MTKMVLTLLLAINCVVELIVRINDSNDSESSLYASDLFGPVCLLISVCLAFTMTVIDKVFLKFKIPKIGNMMQPKILDLLYIFIV